MKAAVYRRPPVPVDDIEDAICAVTRITTTKGSGPALGMHAGRVTVLLHP